MSVGALDGPIADEAATARRLTAVRTQARRLLDVLVGVWIFMGGLVFIEPSPYELTFIAVVLVALVAGVGLYRSTLGLLLIFVGLVPFALIGAFQASFIPRMDAIIYAVVTFFMVLTAYFAANYVAEAPIHRMRIIVRAYTAIAIVSAFIGILAYLGLLPGADLFIRYGRAKAAFKDPNVYGPFLVLPAMYGLQRFLLGQGRKAMWGGIVFMILFVGVFVSFSRAAWGHFAASSLLVLMLCFFLEAYARDKVRIMVLSLVGITMLAVCMAGLLSIPAVNSLFSTRTEAQGYDGGETGRFGRQGYAWELALSHPWGLGAGDFSRMRVNEEPHNTYVSVVHLYGWGGGAVYYILIFSTLWRGLAGLVRPSPYRPLLIPLVSTYAMLIAEAAIIDTDHWRHFFLLAGLIWGVTAAMRRGDPAPNSRAEALV